MDNMQNPKQMIDKNNIFVDLLFDLAAGESVKSNGSYEEQIEYFLPIIIPNYGSVSEYIEYGQKYRMASKYMFPGKPERIKNRGFLIKIFTSFVVLKEMAECNSWNIVSDAICMQEIINKKFVLQNGEDQTIFSKEVSYLTKRYADLLDENIYNEFLSVMRKTIDDFENIYSRVVEFVVGDISVVKRGTLASVLELYHISQEEITKFHLAVDAIAEIVVIKNRFLEYEDEFKSEWEKHFPNLKYSDELKEYINKKKSPFIVAYGNNISSIRNENLLFMMLSYVTVKLAIVDGAKNVYELTKKINDITRELGNNIKDAFADCRKNAIRCYCLNSREQYPSDFGSVLIPYRSDLMYLRDVIMEEISFRNAGNIVHKQVRKTKDASEYELLLSQKDAEIYNLKKELEYYENIKQQEFKAEVSQYNKALTDLLRKMCDFKYNSPLNELYLLATGAKELSAESGKGILQNLMFIFNTMNIVPYETGNIGRKVKFYDDEANIVYAVDESKIKEGLNQGILIYPGWKYKDAELVLPRVDVKEE